MTGQSEVSSKWLQGDSKVKPGSDLRAGDMGKVGELGLSEGGGEGGSKPEEREEKVWLVWSGEGRKGGELR